MFNITNNEGNADQNYKISPHPNKNSPYFKKRKRRGRREKGRREEKKEINKEKKRKQR